MRVRRSACVARALYFSYVSAFTCACTAFGMCSLSGVPLYVCACSCACTAVGICSPSAVPIAHECVCGVRYLQLERCTSCARVCVLVRVRARRSVCALRGVPIARECVCVYLHSARCGQSERYTYCA